MTLFKLTTTLYLSRLNLTNFETIENSVIYFVNVSTKIESETLKLNLHLSEFCIDDR